MKKLLTGLLLWGFASFSYAEKPEILHIRQQYQAIKAELPTLDVRRAEVPVFYEEGSHVRAYHDASGAVRFIKQELYSSTDKLFEEFYYEHNTLIFALITRYTYNARKGVSAEELAYTGEDTYDPEKTTYVEDRYYFHNGSMIRWLDALGNPVDPASAEFRQAASSMLEASRQIRARFAP